MKKLIFAIAIALAGNTFAQSNTTDTVTKADASNTGITFNTENNGKNYAANPVSPGMLPPSTGCVLSNVVSGSVIWNALSGSVSNQTIAKHCLYYEAIKTAIAMCQYNTAHQLYNMYIAEEFKIKVEIDMNNIKNVAVNVCNSPVKEIKDTKEVKEVKEPVTVNTIVNITEKEETNNCQPVIRHNPRVPHTNTCKAR
jgi:hypothetical protein